VSVRRAEWRRSLLVLLVPLLACLLPAATGAQEVNCDPGDVEVRSLDFTGNHAFSDAELANAVVATPSNYFQRLWGFRRMFGVRRCIERNELILDRARLIVYYRKRGYPDVAVDTVVDEAGRERIDLTFRIAEGRPTVVDSLRVVGLQGVADSGRIVRNLPVRVGGPFDQYQIEVARDSIRRRLTNTGYPYAEVLVNSDVVRAANDSARRVANVEFNVITGVRAKLGEIAVHVDPREGSTQQIPNNVVRDLVGLQPGRIYRESELERATRNLYQTQAYQHVKLEYAADSANPQQDSTVDLSVQLIERYMRSARTDVGYGTLDCFRTQGEYVDRNFLHGARRLELTGRISKIGVGEPLRFNDDMADMFCRQVTQGNDSLSNRLNYYAGATIRQPTFLGLRVVPDLTLYSERRSEYRAYRRTTPIGGIASLTRERFFRTPITYSYELSYGKTEASPALFCALFNSCVLADQEVLQRQRRTAAVGVALTRDRTDNILNPTRGSLVRLTFRHASPVVFSDTGQRFNKLLGDASRYWRVGRGNVFAVRLQVGGALGGLNRTLPLQERLFGGGPTTVRGFRQNELGPAVYLMNEEDVVVEAVSSGDTTAYYLTVKPGARPARTVPTGGNSVVVANAELRMRSPVLTDLLQYTLFTDVGEVWNRSADEQSLRFSQLKVTPGFGLRVFSPVGAIRLDFGYNRYKPSPGAAYFVQPPSEGGQLLCVSPGNRVPVTPGPDGTVASAEQQPYQTCGGELEPAGESNFLRRFTFFFAIGQAF
jgi:outer membrane protein assembly complex protein YaeT